MTANHAELCGSFVTLPTLSHENHGQQFYQFTLEVTRLSGTADLLRVIAPAHVLHAADLEGGGMLYVRGQVRSYNEHTDTGRRLRIFVFAEYLQCCTQEPCNHIVLAGTLCKPPVYRRTPLGREITDLMLCVRRSCHRSDYLPCIAWGPTARWTAAFAPGQRLELIGRLQSREYCKVTDSGTQVRTAYEISILSAQAPPTEKRECISLA